MDDAIQVTDLDATGRTFTFTSRPIVQGSRLASVGLEVGAEVFDNVLRVAHQDQHSLCSGAFIAPGECRLLVRRGPLKGGLRPFNAEIVVLPEASVSQIATVISHATAPAFLLGAIAGFISVLMSRMNNIIDRSRTLHAIPDNDGPRARLKLDIPRLKSRAKLANRAIYFAVASGIVTSFLIVLTFACALLQVQHEPGAALLFIAAVSLFCASLFELAREVHIALVEADHLS